MGGTDAVSGDISYRNMVMGRGATLVIADTYNYSLHFNVFLANVDYKY